MEKEKSEITEMNTPTPEKTYAEVCAERNEAIDALRKIENIAANHPDTPLLALDSIIMTARKALVSYDKSPTT